MSQWISLLIVALVTALGFNTPTSAASQVSAVTETRVIGHSVEGRPILAYRVGNPAATRKVVIIGAMHGNETGPSRLLNNLRSGANVIGADIWLIPYLNPDGRAANRRQNAHGVDLNRNFPAHWVRLQGVHYSGPRPASEPETQAVMRFLDLVHPSYVISFHQPLYGVGRSGLTRGALLERRLARGLSLPRKNFDCMGACHGTMTDWFNRHRRGVAITVEYGNVMTQRQLRSGPRGLLAAVGAHR